MARRYRRTALVTFTLFALLITVPRPDALAQQLPPSSSPTDGEMRLAPNSPPGSVTGGFSEGGRFVEFESRSESPTATTAQLSVNGKRFHLARDMAAGVANWGGGGNVLVPEDRAVTRALLRRLQTEWVRPAKARRALLPPERDLLARLAMLVSEAPLGATIGDQEVPRPASQSEATDGPPARSVVGLHPEDGGVPATARDSAERCIVDLLPQIAGELGKPMGSTEVASVAAAQCQVADDNGIWYFNCQSMNRALCHDTRGHCWLCESLFSGPGSPDCLGECGPGCNGLNIYTYDCGDHDRCARVHGGAWNPCDADCGDEYWDADDDFIWGWPNCW